MSGSRKNDRSYLEALRKLRHLVASDYKEGGFLPSGREMCAQFNVSRNTYIKALRCLEVDGTAKSYSTNGHYIVPEFLRIKKIGIVLQGGEDSPFLYQQHVFGTVLTQLTKCRLFTQFIQAADFNSILDKALIHGVIGVLWLFPNANQVLVINQLYKKSSLPFWIVSLNEIEDLQNGIPIIQREYQALVNARIKQLKQNNHRKVAYVAQDGENDFGFKALKQALSATGIRVYPISYTNDDLLDLSILSEDRDITALIVEGSGIIAYNILGEFSKLKNQHSITDIHIHDSNCLHDILECYPDVKVTAVGYEDSEKLATTVVESVVDCFIKGIPVKSQKVPIYRFEIM